MITNKEIEFRLANLERNFKDIATVITVRSQKNESGLSSANAEIVANNESACQKESVSVVWDKDETYLQDYYVLDDNKLYKCKIDNYGQKPSESPNYWEETNVVVELNKLVKELKAITVEA